jgi:SAM-dependent methyltransferase
MTDDIEYVGLMAEAWDALRGDTSDWEDRPWFLAVIRDRGEPVLDVGCGTGRLLLDFLGLGVDIDGVGGMERLDLPRRYSTIIVPSSSFQLVLDPGDADAAMRRLRDHLVPGGSLAMPFIRMDAPYEERWSREATLPDGSLVRRTAVATFDPATGLESTDDLYEVERDGVTLRSQRFVRPAATRAYSRAEARALYERAGFVDLEWAADFTDVDRPDGDVFTIVARRPGCAAGPAPIRPLRVDRAGIAGPPRRPARHRRQRRFRGRRRRHSRPRPSRASRGSAVRAPGSRR